MNEPTILEQRNTPESARAIEKSQKKYDAVIRVSAKRAQGIYAADAAVYRSESITEGIFTLPLISLIFNIVCFFSVTTCLPREPIGYLVIDCDRIMPTLL